jgi:GntR family transcriptional regulator, vanillate catabolism transcriptional regulator
METPPDSLATVASTRNRQAAAPQSMRALLRLRELLLSGEFQAGARISELPLVERLGVSRTPLRLALAKLEHEGLIELLPGGGYVMREFTSQDIHDAIELRGIIEGTAARFAAQRGVTSRQLAALRTLVEQMHVAVHSSEYEMFEQYVGLNERFHARILELARSPVLQRSFDTAVTLPFASPIAFVQAHWELEESREILIVAQAQHRSLVEAISRREGARAERIAREHALVALRTLEIVVRHREMFDGIPGAALLRLDDPPDPS